MADKKIPEKMSEEVCRYSRQQLELLRFINGEQQEKVWNDIYCNLGVSGRKAYDGLENNGMHKPTSLSSDTKILCCKEDSPIIHEYCNPGILGSEDSFIFNVVAEEDSESDEDYTSLQMPAFFVEGEPNFDSGPPEDGLEYLRRVRWEASQFPRVKVAEVDRSDFKEQTAYIPNIPDIADCPSHLLPSIEWENELLSDFSALRKVLSDRLGPTTTTTTSTTDGEDTRPTTRKENTGLLPDPDLYSFSSSSERREELLSEIAGMESIERVWKLEKLVDSIQGVSSLSRDDFSSLLALCAVVDLPLHAATSSSLRSLLRKCAGLRSLKSELDDDVIMLNVLATIAGRYFGQLG